MVGRTGLPTRHRGNGKALRLDGWANALQGIGDSRRDPRRSTIFKQLGRHDATTLEALYRENGFARRIIDLPANSMTRNWFQITGDEDDKIAQRLETLGAQFHTTEALKWASLYGGSVVFMGIDDGQFQTNDPNPDLTLPVKPENIRAINFLAPYAAWREAQIDETSIDKDSTSPLFGQPTIYRINRLLGGGSFDVHISRLLRFDGAFVPRMTQTNNSGWHDSVFQAAYAQLRQVGTVFDNAEIITAEFVKAIIKIANLSDMIAQGQEDILKKRLDLMDRSRHLINTTLLDSEEGYEKHSSSVAGLDTLLDRFMMALSAVTGIPVTLLMGRSPAGENATGASDVRFWYDKVEADQNNVLKPRLEKLIRYLFLEQGKEPEEWSIEFNPLFKMTEKETAELYKATAEGDAVYIQNGVLDPEEVAVSRFGGETFNTGSVTLVDREEDTEPKEEPEVEETPAL